MIDKSDSNREVPDTSPRAEPPLLELTDALSEVPRVSDPGAPQSLLSDKTVPVAMDKLIQTRLLLQADSGGGKSWALRYFLEQTFHLIPQVVIDVEGEFSTLREAYPYVLVSATEGEGDLRADPETARALCRRVAELNASVILDLYDLDEKDQQAFTSGFAEELLSLPKELWTPRLVLIDEAERLAPEQGAAASKSAISSLVSRARKRKIGVILAAHNLSDLSKKAARSLHNKMIGLATLDTDMRRSASELGFDKARMPELASLEPGTFFCHGPAFPYRGVRLVRTGPVTTTHDPLSQNGPPPVAAKAPDSLATILADLKGLNEPSGLTAESNTERANDQHHRTAKEERPDGEHVEALVQARLDKEVSRRLDEHLKSHTRGLESRIHTLEGILERTRTKARDLLNGLSEEVSGGMPEDMSSDEPPGQGRASGPANRGPENRRSSSYMGERRAEILRQLEVLRSHGVRGIDRRNLALFSGRSPRSSTYEDELARLKRDGAIDYPRQGHVGITDQGREIAKAADPALGQTKFPHSIEDLHAGWLNYLGDGLAGLLAPLIDVYPKEISRRDLARLSGRSSKSSTYEDSLARIKKIGLVEYPGPGMVRATKLLFPDGLPQKPT